MAIDKRKSAVTLTLQERAAFLEALIRLKHKPAGIPGVNASLYDQFVALHQAIMVVRLVNQTDTLNMGHWNIGFCPWHREYIRRFELALQAEIPGVTLPYWDWASHDEALIKLFVDDFLGSLLSGPNPRPIITGFLSFDPPNPLPAWWPAGAVGWRIHPDLQEIRYPEGTPNRERLNATLHRGGSLGVSWPPSTQSMASLAQQHVNQPPYHHFWFFWDELEQGFRTHNAGHNFIGGHMGGYLSPNDPIFWLHHSNVDRLWALWQQNHLVPPHGGSHRDHYPTVQALDPWTNELAPEGHKLNDFMWPWVGTTPGYTTDAPIEIQRLIQDFSTQPPRQVAEVLDTTVMGYEYET